METIQYILKSAGILSLFYLVYIFLLKKETHFTFNRLFLLIGVLAAAIFPIIQFTKTIIIEAPALASFPSTETASETLSSSAFNSNYSIENILLYIYVLGVIVFSLRFIYQLISLFIILENHPYKLSNNCKIIEVSESISPFSFFNYIVFNPTLHTNNELAMILAHEIAHIEQLHTIDVLASNLLLIIQWFNPLAWGYKSSIVENLEYLADRTTITRINSKKEYQLALLNTSLASPLSAPTNKFYNSFIKKRIIMLNKANSNRQNAFKAMVVVPLLTIFLWGFNVNEVKKYVEIPSENNKVKTDKVKEKAFQPVLDKKDIAVITTIEPVTESIAQKTPKAIIKKQSPLQETYRVKIDKNTTDASLQEIKEEVKSKYGLELRYAAIRNNLNEITSLTLTYTGNGNNGNYQVSQDKGIDEFFFFIDKDGKTGFWSEAVEKRRKERMQRRSLKRRERSQDMNERKMEMQERIQKRKMEIEKRRSKMKINHPTPSASPNNEAQEVQGQAKAKRQINKKASNTLYFIDGIASTKKQVELLLPENIDKVNVLKSEKALKKYGGKGVNGVIEITTKK
ncbi:M56 family metallopeptidase [Aequorivita xiaoshiensis]|uniref:M48 family metalloprotease n=1 Tax=Aequorivita xiaoshiensis TaxID=2874476 RepID=A0A9X1R3G8_9FLAO|nr:M56 family metallopeptidase [Aequorivita xiaoshiensis]MCG2430868.1 M48 family metalloprotease [Aequorivita xiaoshiensis]